jgi:uncharacterized cupredoxin-like copper-binding protein
MEVDLISRYRRILVGAVFFLFVGLALSACSGNGAASSSKVVDVTVTATEFKFDSSLTTFQQGVPYHFIVTNKGSVNHDFAIMAPASGDMTADNALKTALVGISGDQLTPGTTKTVDYTFTKAYPAGSLEIACHTPGHYDSGMHLSITVQ